MRFVTAVVAEVITERAGLQRILLDGGRRAYVLTDLIGSVSPGDAVVVNTTAVDLGLGTGGWDVVHWNLARHEMDAAGGGHIMKLRYTSLQRDTGSAEEAADYRPGDVSGRPVIAAALHSQLAPIVVAAKATERDLRVVFVMTDSAALPLALSDQVHELRSRSLLDATVTAGHAFGGDFEAVNTVSAMAVAFGPGAADLVVVGPGPGVVGTATRLGFGGLEVAAIVDAAAALGGVPIVAARYSDADERARHRGVSHHTRTALELAHATPEVPTPQTVDVPDVAGLLDAAGLTITTMGRGPDADAGFFAYAAAAGVAGALAARR